MQESGTRSGMRPPVQRARHSVDPDVEPTVELALQTPEPRAHDNHDGPLGPAGPEGSVGPGGPDGPAPEELVQARPASTPADIEAAVQRAHLALGFDQGGELEERSVQLVLEVDEHGVQRSLTQRTVWRATRAGADSFPVFALLPTPVGERVVVEALEGCTTGPTYADLREGLFATSLLLPRRLAAGEEATTVHRIMLPGDAAPQTSYEHRLKQWVDDVTLEIRFHPELLPNGGGAFVRVGDEEEPVPVTASETSVLASCGGFGPGVAGVYWQW